jgi:hypothetical protein
MKMVLLFGLPRYGMLSQSRVSTGRLPSSTYSLSHYRCCPLTSIYLARSLISLNLTSFWTDRVFCRYFSLFTPIFLAVQPPNLIFQGYAVNVFRAFLVALQSGAIDTNIKDMIIALNLLVQITPSSLWGEALHVSGLFSHILGTLIESDLLPSFPCAYVCKADVPVLWWPVGNPNSY